MLSILMSVYNEHENEIIESIDSILGQSFDDFECIIVLDNPKANDLRSLLIDYSNKDSRIKLVENKVNMGLAQSMNAGLKYCEGDYIVRMDADDLCHSKRLEILSNEIFKHRNVDVFYSTFRTINESGRLLKESPAVPLNNKILKSILKNYKNIICHPTVAVKKSSLEQVGGYSDLRVVEDYELWLTMLRSGFIFCGINCSLVDVRLHRDSMTTSNYYKSYLALEFIKKRSKKNSRVSNREFEDLYQKKDKHAARYNYYARQYFELINGWTRQNNLKFIKLIRLLVMEPRLVKYCYETYRAMMLRKV
ncbi:MAG: glycosyltransferase [Lactobacillus crispatus]|nr:glycosyltransferase [Lactobacillus crispatus]